MRREVGPGGTAPEVCVLHTVAALPELFGPLLREEAPHVRPFHVVDESLLADMISHGPLPAVADRLAAHVAEADAAGARAVLVTCSSMGAVAEEVRKRAGIPVLRIDEPMAAEAVRTGTRIGVLATLETTLGPTAELVRREASAQGVRVSVTTTDCPGAYEARQAGHPGEHDRLIAAEALRLAPSHDVLVLAQASMAAALASLPDGGLGIPVLTSPRSGAAQLAALGDDFSGGCS